MNSINVLPFPKRARIVILNAYVS